VRIGLLAGRALSEHHLRVLQPIRADNDCEIALVVIDGRPPKTARQKVMGHLRKGRGAYTFVLALQSLLTEPEPSVDTKEFCRKNGWECLETSAPYSLRTSEQIRAYQLDVMALLCGFGIIREPLLSVCPGGILSYHHGDMRKYRGMPPGWWELYNGEREVGITVQKIAAGLDCGVPIEEKHIPIYPSDTLTTLRARLRSADEGMLHAALKKAADADFTPAVIRAFGTVYTLPNLRQWIALNARIAYRRLRCRGAASSAENP
jgi:folate-dependent phosphoribosylglycinamide formyltransferase PurN